MRLRLMMRRTGLAAAVPPGMTREEAIKWIEEKIASKQAKGYVENVLGVYPGQSATYEELVKRLSRKIAEGWIE